MGIIQSKSWEWAASSCHDNQSE